MSTRGRDRFTMYEVGPRESGSSTLVGNRMEQSWTGGWMVNDNNDNDLANHQLRYLAFFSLKCDIQGSIFSSSSCWFSLEGLFTSRSLAL